MTWNELIKQIMEMPESERVKTAFYREPWDTGAEMFPVDVYEAKEDLTDSEGKVKVKKDEFFLQ